MAAAIGAGLPISEPSGNMILDVGGGTTEVAVISLSGIVYSESTRIGGDRVDDTIVQYMKQQYSLLIGERTAEEIKIQLASAYPMAESQTMEVKGRDLVSGIPKTLYINDTEIREALADVCSSIVQAVRNALEVRLQNFLPTSSTGESFWQEEVPAERPGSASSGPDRITGDVRGRPAFCSCQWHW